MQITAVLLLLLASCVSCHVKTAPFDNTLRKSLPLAQYTLLHMFVHAILLPLPCDWHILHVAAGLYSREPQHLCEDLLEFVTIVRV